MAVEYDDGVVVEHVEHLAPQLLEPGDEIIIPSPAWPNLAEAVRQARAEVSAAGGQVDRALELFDELIRQTSAASDESSAAQRSFLLQQKAAVLESAERADEAISALQETVASWAAAVERRPVTTAR